MSPVVWLLSAPLLWNPEWPLAEKQAKLAPYFQPKPGQALTVSKRAVIVEKRDPLLVKGELWIKPPPKTCFTLRRDYQKRDQRICEPTPIEWEIYDLDAVGRLHLGIQMDGDGESTYLSWPTPYRVANYVPLGSMESVENYNIPIFRCEATEEKGLRKIVLHTMDERRWFIFLPEYDKPIAAAEAAPNLIVMSDLPKEAPAHEAKDQKDKKPAKSVLGQLLSGEYKKEKKREFIFRVPKRNAYEMSSSGFTETSVPQGMIGKCRYVFQDAPGDPESGAIECYDTDTFDTIYAHVICLKDFKPRLRPDPSKKGG